MGNGDQNEVVVVGGFKIERGVQIFIVIFLFPRGKIKAGYMYLSPRTPHIPPKIGHKCPFWRVVQFGRRVPLVVTFAIFIFT